MSGPAVLAAGPGHRGPAVLAAGPGRWAGLTLVEVLVALAVLGIVAGALTALQLSSLRASRTAAQTRDLAAAAEHQLALARLLPLASGGCPAVAGWPSVATCQLEVTCLDGAACRLRALKVSLTAYRGATHEFATVASADLEEAPLLRSLADAARSPAAVAGAAADVAWASQAAAHDRPVAGGSP